MFFNYKKDKILVGICALILSVFFQPSFADGNDFIIKEAKWNDKDSRITIAGKSQDGGVVTVSNAATNDVIGADDVHDKKWRVRE